MSGHARRFFGCVLPLTLAVAGCGVVLMLGYAGQVFFQLRRVPDAAMAPTLEPAWWVIVDNTLYWVRTPTKGDVVNMERSEAQVLRRIIALPGETVQIRGGQLLIDGQPDEVVMSRQIDSPDLTVELGPQEYFVLADNRDFPDSRQWGPIPRQDLYGVAQFYRVPGADDGFESVINDPTPLPTASPTPAP